MRCFQCQNPKLLSPPPYKRRLVKRICAILGAALLTVSAVFSLAHIPSSQAATITYTGRWKPGTITNGNNVNITPDIEVKVEYAPGAKAMKVSYRRANLVVSGTQTTKGNFYDGFCLCIPPEPTRVPAGTGATGPAPAGNIDTIANAVKDFNTYAKTSGGMIWYVLQRNSLNKEWAQGATLSDGAWHTYTYDISKYKAGDDPILLYYGNRHWPSTGSEVYTLNILRASTLGMKIKIAPKVSSSAKGNGTISYTGDKYYEYGTTSDTYTWAPDKGYYTSKVVVDGEEISNPQDTSSWVFNNITSDHTLSVEFSRITSQLTYLPNAPAEQIQGEMAQETYGSDTPATIKNCAYSRAGYTFAGWNTAVDGTGTVYQADDVITIGEQDIVLYAQWERIYHTVVFFDALTQEEIDRQVVGMFDDARVPELPMHSGHRFTHLSGGDWHCITEDRTIYINYSPYAYDFPQDNTSQYNGFTFGYM